MQNRTIKKSLVVAIIVLFIGISIIPCISGNINQEFSFSMSNNPPYEPSDPHPEDGERYVPIDLNFLNWTGGDPDPDDNVTYDVYFDDAFPPDLKSWKQKDDYWKIPYTLNLYDTYYWQIVAWDNHGASTAGPIWHFSTDPPHPPSSPTINGPIHGRVEVEYTYTFNSTDYNGDYCVCIVNWGDDSPIPGIANHSWDKKGNYVISARAIDVWGSVSGWGKLVVTMPRNKATYNSFFLQFLERFPLLKQLFYLVQYSEF